MYLLPKKYLFNFEQKNDSKWALKHFGNYWIKDNNFNFVPYNWQGAVKGFQNFLLPLNHNMKDL